ncbi:MAG: hypothetical protein SFU56_02635 [Capsulimonadales bacterium]|nr:hypothetical protein [Capsulimonadales bacterium]
MKLFGIRAVDAETGRGVPLTELETTDRAVTVTDSNGWAAITDPALMDREVWFSVRSQGYAFPKDGFGFSGLRLKVTDGGRTVVKLRRVNIAERLCRLTGGGIYSDSVLLGESTPLRDPLRPGSVFGQDSAMALPFRGRLLWFWGDTNRIEYPLGNFRTSGAVATFPAGETTAERGLDFAYFTGEDGFARALCPTDQPGPVWISGLTTLREGNEEMLLAHYARMKDLGTRREHGYVLWDDVRNVFRFTNKLSLSETWRFLDGHPISWTENGIGYRAGGFCFPHVRVPARRTAVLQPSAYEGFTCLTADGRVRRDGRGRAVYGWQKVAPPLTARTEAGLLKAKQLRPEEVRFLPRDSAGGVVVTHGGSVTWNPWRRRWILIATQYFGKSSPLGEIWYSEADSPIGPWRRAVKIVTHERFTFYNPVHHPFLDTDGGRRIFFEGTYTQTFSSAPSPTPRYDYNQILYRLDLADPRLRFAQTA